MKALLLENIHPEGVRLLTERGIEVETVKGALDEAELIDALRGVQLLGIRSKTNVTGTSSKPHPTCKQSVPSASAPTRSTSPPPPRGASPSSTRPSPTRAAWWSS